MRRFSILSLMGLVLALAVGLAALRGANDYWAGGLLLATPLLFGVALLGALCGKERSRAGRLGFAILGGGYFALAFLGLSEGNLAKLPTSKLLWFVHERVAGARQFMVSLTTTAATSGGTPSVVTVNTSPAGPGVSAGPGVFTGSTGYVLVSDGLAIGSPPNRWRAMLPGAAQYDAFQDVGHCVFALLAGLLGAVISRRFERGRPGLASPEPSALGL